MSSIILRTSFVAVTLAFVITSFSAVVEASTTRSGDATLQAQLDAALASLAAAERAWDEAFVTAATGGM